MSKAKSFIIPNMPLTSPIFYILLVLGAHELHGYEIMKKVEEESNGKIKLGPGTLYSAIKRLVEADLIRESDKKDQFDDERRRYYKITQKGMDILSVELQRLHDAIDIAKKYNLFHINLNE